MEVTELLGYLLETGDLLKTEAEALLAGIVLDTIIGPQPWRPSAHRTPTP